MRKKNKKTNAEKKRKNQEKMRGKNKYAIQSDGRNQRAKTENKKGHSPLNCLEAFPTIEAVQASKF